MSAPITRRDALAGALATVAAHPASRAAAAPQIDINARLAEIEAAAQGRLGVAILDT
jgi:hypothetical protein